MKMFLGIATFASICGPSLSYASPDLIMSSTVEQNDLGDLPSIFQNSAEGSIGLSNVDYLYSAHSGKDSVFNSVDARIKTQGVGHLFQGKMDLEGFVIVRPATAYTFESPEFYIGSSPELSRVVQVKAGRELHHWSHLDEEYQLGIWQPRLRWDYVRPETVGLAGVFVDIEVPMFQFTIMGSPGFVPDRGVPEEFKNGGIYSESPYFSSPATSVNINGVGTAVNYNLSAPSTSSILLHPTFSTMARVGAEEGLWSSLAYAYKPMNQLLLSYSDIYSAPTANQNAQVTLYPRVAYDSLISAEMGYEDPQFAFWISELEDRPNDEQAIGQTYQVVTPSHAISAAFEYRLGHLKYDPTRIRISGLHQSGGNASDQGTEATGQGSIFEARYPYQNAVQFQIQSPMGWFGVSKLRASYKLLYDLSHQGNIQSTNFDYAIKKSILLNLGTDLLYSAENETATDPISQYRANNRVRFGVSYVF